MSIRVEKLYRHFGNFTALDGVSLDFPSGELVALLGPSGCGKTTLLRVIAGLERADSGSVYLDGEEASSLDIRERHVGFVFQHYALFRHMTVFENVAFGLRAKRRRDREPEAAIRTRVMRLLELVQLDWCAKRYPNQLSGGQRQRIALARALATQPRVLLLDEPFGALDAKVRKELRRWLRRLHDELHVTSLFVTHDQEEALEVADRVVLMNRGGVEQIGTPEEVYDRPATPFVYSFLGSVNRFEGRIDAGRLSIGQHGFSIPNGWPSGDAKGFSRPHELELLPDIKDGDGLPAVIDRILAVGPMARIELQLVDGNGGSLLEAELPRSALLLQGWKEGDRVRLRPKDVHFFTRHAAGSESQVA